MALPLDIRDLMKSGSRFMEERSQPVRLAVFVEVDAPDVLIDAVRAQLRPATAGASLHVEVAELGKPPALDSAADAVIAIAGTGNVGMREALAAPRRMRVPVVVLGLGDEAYEARLADTLLQPTGDLIVRREPDLVVDKLGAWFADSLGSKRLALAHNFVFMRRAVAMDAVKTTALQNALIGTVTPIPGADMPIMTANQIKMLLQIAAAYGQPLGVDRVKELAAVVGGAFLLRSVARQALVAVPVLGWVIKGGIGYSGTMVMGRAAVRYFEDGADIGHLATYLRTAGAKVAERVPRRPVRGALSPSAGEALPVDTELALPDYAEPSPLAHQQALPLAEDESAGV